MTVLHLFNDRTNFKINEILEASANPPFGNHHRIPLSSNCVLMVFAPLSSLQIFEIRKYVVICNITGKGMDSKMKFPKYLISIEMFSHALLF